jgi:hypothetical protein
MGSPDPLKDTITSQLRRALILPIDRIDPAEVSCEPIMKWFD